MDFHPSLWAEVFRQNPVLAVLLGGLVGGLAVTQTAKVLYLQYKLGTLPVTDHRYSLSVYALALLSTFLFTNRLWEFLIGEKQSGLRHVVSLIAGLACPYVFQGLRWGVGVVKRRYNGGTPK
jgi:hypothetical protein